MSRTFELRYFDETYAASGASWKPALRSFVRAWNRDVREGNSPGRKISGKFAAPMREWVGGKGPPTDWVQVTIDPL